ncbi:MAG: PilZ domain-containing protein [Rubrivivax sp.]
MKPAEPDRAAPANPAEQRVAPRRHVIVPITVLVTDGRRLAGRTLDVSAVGVGFRLSEQVNPGSAVAVSFDLPTRRMGLIAVRASGRVANCILVPNADLYRLGVQWVTVPELTLQALRAFALGGPDS